ncbi:MAG: FAD-dependent oxidoreductase [Alphaproteobacteria bacterium]|nr:FAD-dependent oxidoreductase [Alphaproteobacteria bacterium]MBF0250828.1 FAD-dependent oxidoreductase [Alphaproteobacteria bacterium]
MPITTVLSPFRAWKFLFQNPVTVRDPLTERPGAPRYRGFHQNDAEKCVGCGTCETICQNGAIDMIDVGLAPKDGDSGLRPRIDYGRCCWCALCVDVCMTGSLSMSNAYTWTDANADAFRFTPGVDKKPWDNDQLGYRRPEGHALHGKDRVEMAELEPEARIGTFDEIVAGYDVARARLEADRCVECGLCVATCPAHMAIPQYIKAVRDGDYERGLALLYETNPFSQVCGRVCTHKCETACAAGHEGDPIAIRWLKRHITDQVPHKDYVRIVGKPKKAAKGEAKTIAVVGAGPAGLTAAYDLARQGHKVVVYEVRKHPGGMPRYGIPEYRLPYDILDADIDVIRAMGVEIKCETRVGSDITMDELKAKNDAVILAIGLHLGRSTRIPGSDHADVRKAVDLLRQVTDEDPVDVPKSLVVIGGGNVAMDIARTMARLQMKAYGEVAVTVTALEDKAHFLADPDEIRECGEEGIDIVDARGPQEVVIDADGRVEGLRTWRVQSIFDAQGRFAPSYDESDERIHPGDMVIEAIGQAAGVDMLGEGLTEALEWNRGRIQVDADGRTSESWLWAIGDCVKGPDVVHAVADGHRAAKSILAAFEGKGDEA